MRRIPSYTFHNIPGSFGDSTGKSPQLLLCDESPSDHHCEIPGYLTWLFSLSLEDSTVKSLWPLLCNESPNGITIKSLGDCGQYNGVIILDSRISKWRSLEKRKVTSLWNHFVTHYNATVMMTAQCSLQMTVHGSNFIYNSTPWLVIKKQS